MSAEATAVMASAPETEMVEIEVASDPSNNGNHNDALNPKSTGLHSPPDSNSAMKLDGSDDSELSDLDDPSLIDMDVDPSTPAPSGPANQDHDHDHDHDQNQDTVKQEEDEDIGEVLPDHWSGTVPVFKPDMNQFKDFKKFMTKIDCYGMKSGIVKIIPPKEWTDKRPPLDDMIKQIRVKEPIKQDIMGSNGTYRQVNILHQRSYNIPQWRQLCDQSEHQPPARRGERRAQAPPRPKPAPSATTDSKKRGRPTRGRGKRAAAKDSAGDSEDRPMTPVSPKPNEEVIESVEQDPGADVDDDDGPSVVGRMGGARQAKPKTQSTSARRKYARREASARIDEEAFKGFDYRMDISDYTPERCEDLERIYWKTLTYAPPLYGADLPGTLFDDECDTWNLNKLPNLLDVLGTKVPGVNTAYLYLGMWKATFAWHLEDVDLYSINYLHFGAPKQWYSISQGDARRFEAAMKSIWPTEAKACDQFLRHKAFLISPNHLAQYFNIKVNKCVSYPGEFVVTYPYGYHSGYNLGYNCAEAVNFALDSWLPMGKIAKRCECAQAQDSVWVDVYEIERKLRGEETDYEETEDEEEEDEEDDDLDTGVGTPTSSHVARLKQPGRKRKRPATEKGERKAKKIRLRVKNHVEPPCCLCPHDIPGQEVLPTSDGRKAHRICALYGPETWIETVEGEEVVANVENISKARLELKCLYCRSKRGACFQCSQKKCARSYHATCAAAAGVLVEEAEVPIFGEDGTEYKERAFEFSCRFHRTKRDKKLDGDVLDQCQKTRQAAAALKKGDVCQLQYYRGDIFAGVVVENRTDEQTFLLDIIPNGDRVEVEWKWLLLPDPADFHLKRASSNAIPMPTSRKAKDQINATKRVTEELPRPDAPFVEGFTWAEFNACDSINNPQAKVDLSKDNQIWYYLGRTSTEARAQYTDDPEKPKHNPKSSFLDTVPRPAPPAVHPRKSYGSMFSVQTPSTTGIKPEKPYQYKPRDPVAPSYVHSPFTTQQFVPKPSPFTTHQFIPKPSFYPTQQAAPKLVPAPQAKARYSSSPALPKQAPSGQQSGQYFSQQAYLKPSSTPQHTYQFLQQSMSQPASTNQQNSQNPTHQTISKSASTQQHTGQYLPQQSTPGPPSTSQLQPSGQSSSQQTVPKPTPIPRHTPSQNGHTRNRSSLNSPNGQALAFGSDSRFRTPPLSYGTSRIDATAKSPFSHGVMQPPGLGPSPSPQNGQLFQAQARARSSSLASNRSFDTPMTSSAIRPASSASAKGAVGEAQAPQQQNITRQTRPSIVQKYAFFQVHHNRDSTKYRTPYAHWGGFTNGYEGNLRAHLMRSPEALFDIRRRSTGFSAGTASVSSTPRIPFTNGISNKDAPSPSPHLGHHDSPRQSAALPHADSPGPLAAQKTTPRMSPAIAGNGQPPMGAANSAHLSQGLFVQLHPAIRAQYAAVLQARNVHLDNQQDADEAGLAAPSQQSISMAPAPSQTPSHLTPVSTPIDTPTPSVPATDQKLPLLTDSSSSTKTPNPPKQTYVPPPRPWEVLRKPQVTFQTAHQFPNSYSPSDSTTSAVTVPTTIIDNSNPFVNDASGISRHIASLGLEPSNPQPDQLRTASAQSAQPTTAAQQLPTATRQPLAAPMRHSESKLSAATMMDPSASPFITTSVGTTNDLPEVPDESMELIESIIRDARRISDTYSDLTNGNL
ncbi:hypothetical protein F5Y06DRAFT_281847 [Hypoxylon sp. FL0890]|nr:hypothetical protein F5Y06DRAFT_281847 [Hypoxylon sp. FL0890]